jgi:hypothetical protein
MSANGKIINSMAKVNTFGQTEEDTSVTINLTKNMDMGHIIGQMEKLMKVTGKTENNMEKPSLPTPKEGAKLEYGKTVKGSNGLSKSLRSQKECSHRNPRKFRKVEKYILGNYNKFQTNLFQKYIL